MEYNFRAIEEKWQQQWVASGAYKVPNQSSKPKYYVLDMFPYPSGAGLHVGHPLGYIASDIFARYKRLKGFNVLHPMGYDAFGLPAEQYAIEHGVHPADSTEKNINTFRKQLDNIGFSFDWSREVRTSDPSYYRWTQWIFLQLFGSWYNRQTAKAEPIDGLVNIFEKEGNAAHPVPNAQFLVPGLPTSVFTASQWNGFDEKTRQTILMEYRIAYCGYGEVNWCEALGTVLANDEVVNGVSERGGYPVIKKRLRQWYLRITEYADRLLQGLQTVDFSDAMKEMQSNWIGRSSGAEVIFKVDRSPAENINESPSRQYAKDEATLLWEELRQHDITCTLQKQYRVGPYLIDFVCPDRKVAFEIQSGYHRTGEQQEYDEARDRFLSEKGFEIFHFTLEDVATNRPAVVDKVLQVLNEKPLLDGGALVQADADYITVYTTRPDTIFGVDFMVLAPEHELVKNITTDAQRNAVEEYIAYVKSRSERERMAEKKISGVFTGAYAVHPFSGKQLPIWISEYVLAGYGTGAIMAVPSGDERDHKFARHFNLPITNIFGDAYTGDDAVMDKNATLYDSEFLTGMGFKEALETVINRLEEKGLGKRKVNYKIRDAAFSRQRYWGEPFPIVWKDGIAYPLDESELPLELPYVQSYKPGPEGEGPLANIPEWTARDLETNTMPGYAGSSWYFLRYMDPHNEATFCDKSISTYWNQVDLYVGGTEHAVGHLLYSRMWTKALYDLGLITFDEPFKKLLNQGMIQGSSRFVYRIDILEGGADMENFLNNKSIDRFPKVFISGNLYEEHIEGKTGLETRPYLLKFKELIPHFALFEEDVITGFSKIRVDVNNVDGIELDIDAFRKSKPEYAEAILILEDGSVANPNMEKTDAAYICGVEVEKMSKSKLNAVSPYIPAIKDENGNIIKDEAGIVTVYGADTFRMYEMFLGPVEMSKPWDTKGIEGVHRFLKKLWRLFYNEETFVVTNEVPTAAELKVLHKTIKKVEEDTERFSFNTSVSAFMVCVNELTDLGCHKRAILEPLLVLLTPFAPHISEELWHRLGNESSVLDASFPQWEEGYLVETTKEYPISINGKLRTTIKMDLTATQEEVQEIVLANEVVQKWMEDKPMKKLIFVKGKMVNIVV